jgi:phytoene dehydrogenase-like protein
VERSVIIIGAGIAGLAAGCYARMNGYRTQIFELHTLPGGLCTAWERKNYVFDGCLHYLLGTGEGQPYHDLWEELGAAHGLSWIDHAESMRVRESLGRELIVHVDPDKLQRHMTELSPADAQQIAAFARGIRQFQRFDMSLLQKKPRSLMSLLDWMKLGAAMMPFLGPLMSWAFVSSRDFARRFQDPFLRRAIPELFGWPEIPMMAGLSLMAAMSTKNAGVPRGASLEFARVIERRYRDLGGEISYRAQVEKILVEKDGRGRESAVGVRLYDDRIYRADHVISAADAYGTLFYMLGDKYVSRATRRMYDGHLPTHSQIQVSLGVRRDLSHEPHWVTHLLDQPLMIAGEDRHALMVKNYCFDPTLAPAGKSAIVVMMPTDYLYWQRIYGHRLYDTEQDQVAQIVIEFLETIYLGLKADIEMVDVATPLSYERYTGNWRGASSGWLLAKQTMMMNLVGVGKTIPGLHNFYMAGQWVEPGGMVPVVAMSGRNAVQMMCAADKRPFVTSKP